MPRRRSLAAVADKYRCYQIALQEPGADLPFVERVFRKLRGRAPRRLREDFAGTAAQACAWVARHRENTAIAVDLDPEPLDWGRRHNVSRLDPEQQSRVKLVQGDVRDVGFEPVDVCTAYNFSYFLFRTRRELLGYFRSARASLAGDGLLFLDAYGGARAMEPLVEETAFEGFDYVWEQHAFDPIHQHGTNYIHFRFPDGSALHRAFRYDWRLWSLPELRECLAEAGFAETQVYWEGTDRATGEGNDVFTRRERGEADPAWLAHLVAVP